MTDGQGGGIKGIGIAVTADASQIKRAFNEAIQGFESKTIEITLTAKEDRSFERRFAALRGQNIEIAVTLKPTRQTIRDFRRDFNERLAREGGALVPIKPKGVTQREGKELKRAIAQAIGSPIVTVLLEWKWKDGPPPTQFTGGVSPGPGGGGPGPTEAWGPFRPPPTTPVSPQDVNTFIRQEVARRMAQSGTTGAGTGTQTRPPTGARPEPEEKADVAVAAAEVAKGKRNPRKPHRFDQRAGESTEEWTARLLVEHGKSTEKLSSTSADVARRANNRLVQLEKRLGIESDRMPQPVPGKSVTRVGPKEVQIAPAEDASRPQRTTEPPSSPELRAAERREAEVARRFGQMKTLADQSTERRGIRSLTPEARTEVLQEMERRGAAGVPGEFFRRVLEPERIRGVRAAQKDLPGLREELSKARAEVEALRPAGAGAGGKLLSDAINEGFQQARRSGDLTGPTPGTTAFARADLQKAMGIKVGPGGIEDLGQLASLAPGAAAQNRLMERINQRVFDVEGQPERQRPLHIERAERELADYRRERDRLIAARSQSRLPEGVVHSADVVAQEQKLIQRRVGNLRRSDMFQNIEAGIEELEATVEGWRQSEGFRGGGRAARSLASERGRGITPITEIAPRGPSENISVGRVAQGRFLGAFIEEIESGLRNNFQRDADEFAAFRQRWSRGETGWGEGFKRAQEFLDKGEEIKAIFGEREFDPETGRFQLTHKGAFEGALPARAQLDALARARKLPGVGAAAVRYAQAQTRDDIPSGKMTQQGLDYIAQRDALSSLVDSFFESRRVEAENAASKAAGQQSAETTAQALTPPKRPTVPRRRDDETIEAYRVRKAETLEPYHAAVERFEARQAKLMPGLNDPALMQYPAMGTPPRQGLTAERIELSPTRSHFFGVGAFSPFLKGRPQAAGEAVAPTAGPEDLPDLSDLGFSRDDVMRAFNEPAMAAGGVAPPPVPPVPPGTVTGGTGGGGGDWSGGVVPVRVTNWPSSLEGEGAMAAGPMAGVPPSDEMLKMFQTATSQGFEEAMDKIGWKPRQEAEPEEKPAPNPEDIFERGGTARSLRSTLNLAGRLGLPAIDPTELARIQNVEEERVGGLAAAQELNRAEDFARAAVEASPARAVATATGQIFSNLPFIGGRSGILERQREALRATGEARSVQRRLADEQASLSVMEKYVELLPKGSERHRQLSKDVEVQRKRVEATGLAYEDLAKKATKANREVAGVADVARSFTAGVVGTITGQILFQSVFGAAQAAVGGLTQALGPVIERQMGYKNAVAATTNELAAQTAQTGAQTEALVDQRLAAANMTKVSADRIDQLITERAEIMAGNKQIEEQTKLFATAADIQQANARGLGPRGGGRTRFGTDINLYESTGGLLNTSFFAPQQSTQEALGNLFREAGRERTSLAGAAATRAFQQRLGGLNGIDRMGAIMGSADAAVSQSRSLQGLGGPTSFLGALTGATEEVVAGAVPPGGGALPPALRDFDDALQAANNELSLHAAATAEDRDKVKAFADALDRADMQDFANAVRTSGFYVEGLQGMSEDQQARVVTKAAENFARGVARRDPAQIIEGMADQIRASVEGVFEMARIERQLTIPAQRGLSNLANPVIPLSGQAIIGAPATGGGVTGDLMAAFGGREGIRPGAEAAFRRASLTSVRAQGRQAVAEQRELGALDELFAPLGDEVKQDYMEIRSNIRDIGSELAALQQEQVNIQVTLSTDQFNEQLRQVRRGLADARERASGVDAPGNTDNLGLLERRGIVLSRQAAAVGFQQQQLGLQSQALQLQNQLLGRRSQLLSFQSTELGFQSKQLGFQLTAIQLAQNQRQINFQQAVAGFTAPGTTPEERAARIAEAKAEAAVAQQQQDIAVRQFGIEQQQFGIEQQQFGLAQAQFSIDAQQLAIQQQAYVLAQQQYGLSVAQFQNQQAIIDVQNARAVEDLGIQERLINAAITAQQALAANESTIANLRRELEAEMQMAGSYLQQASGVATTIAQTSTALLAQFGGDLGKIVTAYANAWVSFRNRTTMSSSQWFSQNPETRYGGGQFGETFNAPGAVGMVSAPTHMVVGDAGGEMVAVLRNPKPVATGLLGAAGGGNFTQVNVTVTGNSVRNDDDLERLASLVGRRVEQELGRRARMLGFGPVR